MGQHACCISQTDLDYPNQNKGIYLVKDKKGQLINHIKGHEDSIITLPYQEEQRQLSVQVEDINSQQYLDKQNLISPLKQQQQNQKSKYQFKRQVRVKEEYSKTFEPNDIDLSKSDGCSLETQSQGKCRLAMTTNQGTYFAPSSPTKVHVVNELKVDSIQRSEYAEKMSQYIVYNCQDGFKSHYYKVSKEDNRDCRQKSTESSKTLQTRIESELKYLQFKLNQQLDNDDISHVYIFTDANDVKFIKCIVTGASQTVFAYGVYIFDIYIPADYPQHPPRVHLKQHNSKITRQHSKRLAPLLLEDGRVCLDILGIHLGIEKKFNNHWDPETSNLCQIIESIRSEILCQDVFRSAQLAEGEKEFHNDNDSNVRSNLFSTASSVNMNEILYAEGYENVIKYITMTQAIENMMEISQIDIELQNTIEQHFGLCSDKIRQKIQYWIEQQKPSFNQENQPKYTGIVEQHNREIASLMQKKGFVKCAQEKLNVIQEKIKIITQHIQDSRER